MKTKIFTAILFLSSVISAQDINLNSMFFSQIDMSQIGAIKAPVPENSYVDIALNYSGEIKDKLYLLPQTGKDALFTFVDNEEEFKEFQTAWLPILDKYGLKVENIEYKKDTGFAVINYKPKDGFVIRNFWADRLNYDALNEKEILKLKNELISALDESKMEVIASFRVNNPAVRPTFKLYYLTKKALSQEKEIQLRQLKNGEDIDFELLENAVKIVRKDAPFSLVYIGKELGFVSKLATDMDAVNKKVEEYKKFLKENKKELINYKIIKLEKPIVSFDLIFNYLINFYFFQ